MLSASSKSSRVTLFAHFKARRPEIEDVIVARVRRMAESAGAGQRYIEGLEAAVAAALDFGFAAFRLGGSRVDASVPAELLTQARLAARSGAPLDAMLHQYFAGYSLLSDFLVEEAEKIGLTGGELKYLLRAQTALLDRIVVAVSEEFQLEADIGFEPSERRRVAHVKRLLAGEVLDLSEFAYSLEASHVGMIGTGYGVIDAIRDLAKALDCRLLMVRHGEQTAWAWLGTPSGFDSAELDTALASRSPMQIRLAIGEPGDGIAGWRLTHEQARSVAPIALRGPKPVVRYREAALLASMLQDTLLVRSLRRLYLEPLSKARNGGVVLRQTLRAYFLAERNTSSAAAALGVSRQTVINRLRTVEGLLERPLNGCAMELEAALRLEDWDSSSLPG